MQEAKNTIELIIGGSLGEMKHPGEEEHSISLDVTMTIDGVEIIEDINI